MAAINPKPRSLRLELGAAVSALLGFTTTAQAAKEPPAPAPSSIDRWVWDASFTRYSEAERISVIEPQIGVRRDFGDDRSLNILATVDTISGATPLGTLPLTLNTAPNTITGPSGRPANPYIGKVPITHMTDTRIALNSTYQRPSGSAASDAIGGGVSVERDFTSFSGSYSRNHFFHQKNTTLSWGVSPEYDIVAPHGGLPYSYGPFQSANEYEGRRQSKYVIGGLFGVSQVINRRMIMQWNYSPTYENGYLNDPYKLLSFYNTQGDPVGTIHEKRPGHRLEHSLYWSTRLNMREQDVFALSFRYFWDSWGIRSQTFDFTYRWQYHAKRFAEPHVRYYHQTKADFFRIGLPQGQALPANASADYRLNDLDGVTFGLRMGWVLRNGSELILRAELYTLSGEQKPNDAVGAQRSFDLFPTVHASILQVDYKFEPSRFFRKK